MAVTTTVIAAAAAAVAGIVGGYFTRRMLGENKDKHAEEKIEQKIASAKEKLGKLKLEAEAAARGERAKVENELDERRHQIIELEKRVAQREAKLDSKLEATEEKEAALKHDREELKTQKEELIKLQDEEQKRLEETAGLTGEQAAERIMQLTEERTKEDIVRRVRRLQKEGERELEEKARDILSTVIQRYASSHVAEHSTSYVDVPDEGMIGRIIGREGRNIQHIERVTGCEVVIDSENSGSIMISGFSPVRRQVAKRALEQLLKDGRIHPGRIEEVVEEAKKKINDDIREAGEAVVYDLGIVDFPPKLVHLVGRMKYRTSYGQNILRHSWEAARIAMMLAEELGADVTIAKKATLLHDIGKAIDHEVEGNHVEIGEKIMRKFGISEEIVKAAAAHHEDYPFDTREAIIVQVSDAISAARPGARREGTDQYIKRMEDLEQIAASYEGVQKAYAIYAGREIRVFVEPKKIDDLQAIKLAQDIAKQIEQELTYPGDVKINVIRETRSDALAR
ncbi:MAG: ribonuclease Y [Candidatus Andersenbacteria bacterium]|nr:ribonuclease Y [Candidatus Andersenbacteria bacterium]MBI3250685.1 ribonuclease Y [Candidatus Andersenbacteria bacterium]